MQKKQKLETSALTEEEKKKAITAGEFQLIKTKGWTEDLKTALAKARREKDEPNLVVPSMDEWQIDDESNFIQRERTQLIAIMGSKKTDSEKFKQITTALINWNRQMNFATLKKKNESLYKALDAKKTNETEALLVMQAFIDDLNAYRDEVKQSKEGNKIHKNVEAVLIELKKEFPPGFSAFNYVGHGGGAFADRFHSADMYPKGGASRVQKPFGETGFFDQQTAYDFALAIDRSVGTTGGSYQILYNDFAVAREANKALKHGKIFNVDNVTMSGKKDDRHVANLNWHGPLVTHFHVDFAV